MTVWVVRAATSEGFLREISAGNPIITASLNEAQQFPSRADAERVVEQIRSLGNRVPTIAVEADLDKPQQPHYEP